MANAIRRLPQISTLSTVPPESATQPLTRSSTPLKAVSSRSGWIKQTNSYLRMGMPPFHGFAPLAGRGPAGSGKARMGAYLNERAVVYHRIRGSVGRGCRYTEDTEGTSRA